MREESLDTLAKNMLKLTSDMRNSFMNFHSDINKFLNQYASNLSNTEDTINYGSSLALLDTTMQMTEEMNKLLSKNSELDGLPGKDHPDRWPEGLDKMIERLSKLDFLGLFHEDHRHYEELLSKMVAFVKINVEKLAKGEKDIELYVESIKKGTTVLLLFALAFGDFAFWVILAYQSLKQWVSLTF